METLPIQERYYVKDGLISLFKERYNLDFKERYREYLDSHLLGAKLKLNTLDLLYLFKDVEKKFNIIIPEEEIVKGRFSTFNNILEIIYTEIN